MFLRIKFTSFNLEWQPGFWEGEFLDAFGKKHIIMNKIPMIFEDFNFDEEKLPQEGFFIPGEIKEIKENFVLFSTLNPYEIESKAGETEFYVFKNQLNDKALLLK